MIDKTEITKLKAKWVWHRIRHAVSINNQVIFRNQVRALFVKSHNLCCRALEDSQLFLKSKVHIRLYTSALKSQLVTYLSSYCQQVFLPTSKMRNLGQMLRHMTTLRVLLLIITTTSCMN